MSVVSVSTGLQWQYVATSVTEVLNVDSTDINVDSLMIKSTNVNFTILSWHKGEENLT